MVISIVQETIFAAVVFLTATSVTAQQPENSKGQSPDRLLYYDLSNASDKRFHIMSARSMHKKMDTTFFGGPGAYRVGTNSVRLQCNAEQLARDIADFIYWEEKFTVPDSNPPNLKDDSKMLTSGLPFPEFDEDQKVWTAHFTLQPDCKWIGQYEGVTVKPIGEAIGKHNATTYFLDYQWIHLQFKNASGKGIHMQQHDGKFLTGEREAFLFIPEIPPDNKFHGFAAHCHKGSMFRPKTGSKIVFSWAFPGDPPDKFEEFELPDFSDDYKNWYCYFTLDKNEKWTAVFEGVKEK